MASGGDEIEKGRVAEELDQFLRGRSRPNIQVDGIVLRSQERAKTERKHSADADDLSRREKERKLEKLLSKQRRRRKSLITVTDVRVEAAKILEEFLQSQLREQSVQTKHDHPYQRFMEMRISEETTQTGDSTGHFTSHSTLEREDSIPYADDSEAERDLKKAGSLPHDDMLLTYASRSKPGVEIIHGKSKSVPYKGLDETALPRVSSKSGLKPPPPPPPGTPFSPSDGSGSKESLSYVPYTGLEIDGGVHNSGASLDLQNSQGYSKSQEHITKDSVRPFPKETDRSYVKPWASSSVINHTKIPQTKVPNSLDLPSNDSKNRSMIVHPSVKSGSPTKSISPRRRKSGSDSEIDSDSDPDSHVKDRKKKPLYKRAQERFQLLIGKHKDISPEDEDAFSSKHSLSKKKEKKKQKKHAKLPVDDADSIDREDKQGTVLEDRYIHSNKHIHQTHSGQDNGIVIRTEESTEITDIVSDSEKKHIEKRLKVRESAEGGKGFFGRIKRMTSREKGARKKIKGILFERFHKLYPQINFKFSPLQVYHTIQYFNNSENTVI